MAGEINWWHRLIQESRKPGWDMVQGRCQDLRVSGRGANILEVRKEEPKTCVPNHCDSVLVFYSCLHESAQT